MVRLALLFAALLQPLYAGTLDELIAKHLAARGGIDRIRAVRSQRITGTIRFGPDASGTLVAEMKRPGMMREEVSINGVRVVRTTNGKAGWSLNPLRGDTEPQPLPEEELRSMAGPADFDGPLVDYKKKGHRITLAGREKVEGRDAYKLVIELKEGESRIDFLDAETLLEVKWEGEITNGGERLKVESFFRDYRAVEGIQYAFRIESNTLGTPVRQGIEIEKVELNVESGSQRFGRP